MESCCTWARLHTQTSEAFHLYKVLNGFDNLLSWRWQRDTLSNTNLRAPVGLDDIFDCPPADGAARIGHLLEFEATGVAETHVSTGVEDRVNHILVANGAFVTPRAWAGWEVGEIWVAGERRARGCTLGGERKRY